jgi:hypothetical protein
MSTNEQCDPNLSRDCRELAGEIHKVYQRMNLAGRNASVDRLLRRVNQLVALIERVGSSSAGQCDRRRIEEMLLIIHECVPLLDLNLKSLLLSKELHQRWTSRLEYIGARFNTLLFP